MSGQTPPRFFVLGGAHMDQIGRSEKRCEPGQSNPGFLHHSPGGVAGNIARGLAMLDWSVALSTILGQDADGDFVEAALQEKGVATDLIIRDDKHPTATYTAIEEPTGALVAGLASMQIYDHYPLDHIEACLKDLPHNCTLVADTNLPAEVLKVFAQNKGARTLAVCAVSGPKANRVADCLEAVDLLFCNETEAAILAQEYADLDALPEILLEIGVTSGVITKGGKGVTAWAGEQHWQLPAPPVRVKSTNGAGDSLAACLLHGLALHQELEKALPYGMAGASLALMSNQAIPDMLSRTMLDSCLADIPAA
ncbi:MAG: PfkB family carbohydrate kinase [Cohaesibacter sp.]|jgi:pseudouridine kinase|nr:PfkB family carbohydrate kinase [Cohaesibacter sp.]